LCVCCMAGWLATIPASSPQQVFSLIDEETWRWGKLRRGHRRRPPVKRCATAGVAGADRPTSAWQRGPIRALQGQACAGWPGWARICLGCADRR
jgi:hypothetical protein